MTKLQRLIRRPAPERGFTLIELLVVIIILGILAAVVVFAVSGVGDKGKSSAVAIDDRTLRTAEEAYCAKNGKYGSGAELVTGGFLSDSPKYHKVAAQKTGFGQCNGWTYSIVETEAASGVPAGTWAAGPQDYPGDFSSDAVRLPSGNVVMFGFDRNFLWNVTTGTWTQVDSDPLGGGPAFGYSNNMSPVLTQNCGGNCGKLPFKIHGRTELQWHLFDPEGAPTTQWQQIPDTDAPPPGLVNTVNELKDNPSTAANECGPNCGKVLITVSANGGFESATLYDPNLGPNGGFIPVPSGSLQGPLKLSALLPDGRILIAGRPSNAPLSSIAMFFDPVTLIFSPAPTPPITIDSDSYSRPPMPVMANGDILFGSPMVFGGIAAQRAVYSPQYGQDGSWNGVVDNCAPGNYCRIVGVLPDGRVLAYPTDEYGVSSATSPGQTYVLDYPNTRTWVRVPSPGGDFDPAALGATEVLDPRAGPCGAYCNKVLMAGNPGFNGGGAYTTALFTP